jgi:hypothetical protein
LIIDGAYITASGNPNIPDGTKCVERPKLLEAFHRKTRDDPNAEITRPFRNGFNVQITRMRQTGVVGIEGGFIWEIR